MTNLGPQPRNHPTGRTRFSARAHTAPALELLPNERSGPEVYHDLLVAREVIERRPVGVSATRAALRNSRGEPNGAIREVRLDWDSDPGGSGAKNFEVIGPKDGRPIIVNVPAGFPDLIAVSGCVVLIADSGAGNHMKVREAATAIVFAQSGRKVSITADAGSVVDFYAAEGARGYQTVADGALFTAHGDVKRVRLSTDPDPMFAGLADKVAADDKALAKTT